MEQYIGNSIKEWRKLEKYMPDGESLIEELRI